eukprot:Awhi_evm1s10556
MKHSCIKNQHHMDIDIDITDLNDIKVPLCEIEGCGSSARPNCTLFTESLPSAQWQSAYAKCCLLLVLVLAVTVAVEVAVVVVVLHCF